MRGTEDIDERGLQRNAAAQRFGKFPLARESLGPGIEALRLGQIDLRGSFEKTLEKRTTNSLIETSKRLHEQIKKAIFRRRLRPHRIAGLGHESDLLRTIRTSARTTPKRHNRNARGRTSTLVIARVSPSQG